MQSLEAILSLLVFLLLSVAFLFQYTRPQPLDDSLYRLQLADDAWRVLYLRGDFDGMSDANRGRIESDMRLMGDETGLCFFMSGVEFTNCRDGRGTGIESDDGKAGDGRGERIIIASISRTVFIDGEPKKITFSVGR